VSIPRSVAAVLTVVLLLSAATATPARAAERLILDHATISVDSDEPPYVRYGVQDLVAYLTEVAKKAGADSSERAKGVRIVVGARAARSIVHEGLPDGTSGDEGYLLRAVVKGGQTYVIAAGATPRGTKAALMLLMKTIQIEGKSAIMPADLHVSSKPAIRKRGMHFNGWAFNSPYSFRNWTEDEWKRYLDVLAYQGVNLFYLWPFIEIMPVPLSPEDQAYLEECRRVVDYAQQKHGMEVWIMQCTNRVARDRCGVADPRRRPYWRPSQQDLNPGNPEHFKAIMASREAMYRILDNVDGVCNIDSDPGYCPGSPLSDYVKALKGFRELLDRHNRHGRQTLLVNWMWMGWGRDAANHKRLEGYQRETIRLLKKELPEPWGLIAGWGSMLSICREEGVIGKTVLLPYGTIEGEPSYPATNLQIDGIRPLFNDCVARYPELGGMMGNVQTPLLQFPHVYHFTSAMFDAGYRNRPEREVILDLCRHLYPEHEQLLADCYLALKGTDPVKIQTLADQLDGLVRQDRLGQLGVFGRKLFPDGCIVAQSLVLQLNVHAARQRLARGLTPSTSLANRERLLADFYDAYLTWDAAHGWHGLWGWNQWPMETPPGTEEKLAQRLGDEASVDAFVGRLTTTLAAKHDNAAVKAGCIAPLKRAVLSKVPIRTLAQQATATASVAPKQRQYPPSAAVDGRLDTLYWPGALVQDNAEWLQITWAKPQTFSKVVVRFLQHPSMRGRTIHLQQEVAPGKWEDFATTTIPANAASPHAVATFQLNNRVTLDKIRIVNLLDIFEVEVY
jgi:hypothetical protein